MANGVDFPGSNRSYGPPEGVTEDQCKTLHIFTNGACLVSCWEFTDEEIAEIVRTRRAFLSVWSPGKTPGLVSRSTLTLWGSSRIRSPPKTFLLRGLQVRILLGSPAKCTKNLSVSNG